ncbi:GNAT family N-acetyltransferase [Dyadobacter sp. CY312]|uniref:GNAT family N-acetyltransferase n=1 Tax=Dyadobacter sp. CY312 TaxID=2907303 RepID=UPI001F27B332|nr:GNAT family N-acetyltransferase [Dyadobacter sp. CY312]MCE7039890.1 GNAT family N-acetyltransferase [Dyadobacter sp. CY312]
MNIEIKQVAVDDILGIRHQVLWPDKSPDFVKVPEDDQATHFGLYLEGRLASVISLFPNSKSIRFRKFATLSEFQNKGLGSKLLTHVIDHARNQQYEKIWCDARSSAMNFYEKFGFEKFSEPFFKEEVEYFKISKRL